MRRSTLYTLLGIAVLVGLAGWIAWPGNRTVLGRPVQVVEGLDLQGGLQVLLQAKPAAGQQVTDAVMDDTKAVVENRVNGLGVSEPVVQRQGSDRIVVELPGVRDKAQAIKTFQGTGLLEFIDAGNTPLAAGTRVRTTLDTSAASPAPGGRATAGAGPRPTGTAAAGPTQPSPPTAASPAPSGPVYTTVVTGRDIESAQVGFDPQTGQPLVNFKLKGSGSKKFADFTTANVGSYLAIALDKTIISSPSIRSPITQGSGQITGVTAAEAQSLAIQLRYGALPMPLEVVSSNTVGATLGQDSVQRSINAGIIGVLAVMLFMLLYYRLPGLVADVALLIYALFVFALFKLIPVTLTLAGIAGFVLSIGMAVDANVLIFARTKDELRHGRGIVQSLEAGFRNAWPSIRDSNISTLITCVILIWFGSQFGASIIRGFALTLAIGVLVSMFTAIVVSRTLLRAVVSIGATRRNTWLWGIGRHDVQPAPAAPAGGSLTSRAR